MKQVIQSFAKGETIIAEVPTPTLRARGVLVQTRASLVSAGTERMLVNFAGKNLLQKAKARPDLVRQVIDKVRTEGILTTYESVSNRMDQPMPLGYSSAGDILSVGAQVIGFQPGDRVACAGGGYAGHAEIAYVPRNLIASFAPAITYDEACFATLGAIAMQGIRQGEVALGANVAVIGLGLVGQLGVQMLKAAGARVFGIDPNAERVALALQMGANQACRNEIAPANAHAFTSGRGFDAVLITADTSSSEPILLAGTIARSRAIIVVVGAVGMEVPRKIIYDKELQLRLSRSYGPGRYDPEYEDKGRDYPYDYVRWTEQRNIEAFLQLLSSRSISVMPLITHRFPIAQATKAYDLITGKTGEPFLGVVLTYPESPDTKETINVRSRGPTENITGSTSVQRVRLGIIGAGNFANATLLPVIKRLDEIELVGIASSGGLTARVAADRFGIGYCTTSVDKILTDPDINTVAILTRHNQHADQVIAALRGGKAVYVEKPLCLTSDELNRIILEYTAAPVPPSVMVGFNRRFAPFIVELKEHLLSVREPLLLHYRVNAGYIPKEHWVQDPVEGGGRLLGEGCHFIDLLVHLAGTAPRRVIAHALPDGGRYSQDNLSVTIEFENGSLGVMTYVANGDKGFPKEFLEVFGGGMAARMDNYRTLMIRGGRGTTIQRKARLRQDKGHRAEWEAFSGHLLGRGGPPIAFRDIVLSMEATLAARLSLEAGEPISLAGEREL
jgi:predicted dehydrogenase/threonine dehydrogenase-like Zn-dependent dehydrogenase